MVGIKRKSKLVLTNGDGLATRTGTMFRLDKRGKDLAEFGFKIHTTT
jgi:hypothetical protein